MTTIVLKWNMPATKVLLPSKIIQGSVVTHVVGEKLIELHFVSMGKEPECKKWTVGTFGDSGRIFILTPADIQLQINKNGFGIVNGKIVPIQTKRNGRTAKTGTPSKRLSQAERMSL